MGACQNRGARWFAGLALVAFFSATAPILAGDPNACDEPGEAPDVIAGSIDGQVVRWGSHNGITAYSIGVTDCNIGTCWANWFNWNPDHPVIAQNLFRLEDGRFEQIGQSWIAHTFFALSQTLCSTGCISTNGSHLGVNCADSNTSTGQGQQGNASPKHEVNASTGQFPYPSSSLNQTGNAIFKRLQVHDTDLDPALHPGASFFFEAQYTTRDDALGGNSHNNASYRRALLFAAGSTYTFALNGPTLREQAAIQAWRASDPSVVESFVDVPGDGRLILAAKVTDLGNGLFEYEYALQNLTSHRSVGSFSVPLASGAVVNGVGFHDVDYHSMNADGSGSYYDGTDWSAAVIGSHLTWSTEDASSDPLANALRWGTLYNFRFRTDVPPAPGSVALGLFLPGVPAGVEAATLVPRGCDSDGVCDADETCTGCPGDCANQAGLGGCCGDATCDAGETQCACAEDCGLSPTNESACADGIDEDCDAATDCADSDCCGTGACVGPDPDADAYAACDCNGSDPNVWFAPGPVSGLVFAESHGSIELTWSMPAQPGATSVTFDVLRSQYSQSFMLGTDCVSDATPGDLTATDDLSPAPGFSFFYLVRAKNGCPAGEGSLGSGSGQMPREGMTCP